MSGQCLSHAAHALCVPQCSVMFRLLNRGCRRPQRRQPLRPEMDQGHCALRGCNVKAVSYRRHLKNHAIKRRNHSTRAAVLRKERILRSSTYLFIPSYNENIIHIHRESLGIFQCDTDDMHSIFSIEYEKTSATLFQVILSRMATTVRLASCVARPKCTHDILCGLDVHRWMCCARCEGNVEALV